MKKKTIIALLKKHYLLVLLTITGILLLGWIGVTIGFRRVLSTPIATIEPKDSLTALPVASKLESYLDELKPKPTYRAAREEVIAIDFSKSFGSNSIIQSKAKQKQEKDSTKLQVAEKPGVETQRRLNPISQSERKHSRKIKKAEVIPSSMSTLQGDGFYTIKSDQDEQAKGGVPTPLFFKAVIDGNQRLKPGTALRLRLKEKASWYGHAFQRNTILYGILTGGSNGRLKIRIIRVGEAKISLSVFDQDMQEGLVYRMNEPVNEAFKESSRDALNEVFYSLPYGGVAGGVARLGRNLFSKTQRKGEAFLADGYEVFIATTQ